LEKETIILAIIIGTCIFFGLVMFILISINFYKKQFALKEKEKKLIQQEFENQLLQTQIEIQEQTLTNISQELHDNIGQSLSLAKLNLNTIKPTEPEQAKENIEATKTLISNALTNIRDLAKSMLGEKITEIGLEQAVRNEVKLLQQAGKYQVHFTVKEEPVFLLSPQQELVSFRILQEAIHNIVKHAEATKIEISFVYNLRQTLITITDNGNGFDLNRLDANNTGIGLKNMQNRAALINAKLNIQSAIFQGTSLTLGINQ
jgi:signal transduction histidine kinase